MNPTRRTVTRITLLFDDDTAVEYSDIKGLYRASENWRNHQGKEYARWNEFMVTWILPIEGEVEDVTDSSSVS